MRAFLLFVGLMIAALAAIAVFTYPAWLLLHPHFNFPFHRLGERIAMLALLIGFMFVAKRAGLADKQSLGYALPRRRFVHEMLLALAIGAIGMLAVVGIMTALGLLRWSDAGLSATALTQLLAARLLSGIAVAFIEETFLRGAMFTALERESGVRTAIVPVGYPRRVSMPVRGGCGPGGHPRGNGQYRRLPRVACGLGMGDVGDASTERARSG